MRKLTSPSRLWQIYRHLNFHGDFCFWLSVSSNLNICDTHHSFAIPQLYFGSNVFSVLFIPSQLPNRFKPYVKLLIITEPSAKLSLKTWGKEGTVSYSCTKKNQNIGWSKSLCKISLIILTLEISYKLLFSTGDYCSHCVKFTSFTH